MSAPDSSAPKPPPKITIDGQVVEFKPGDTIMRAAERLNIGETIPRFCYHPALPVAGTCRMCTVEIEKMPKLMTACSTPAADGMVVNTQSDRVRKSRAGVMEFLLINHPLDCPVCDQAGECSLQDYDYDYGPGTSRFTEDKRVWSKATTKPLSEDIMLNMNRCVHCERCVRFTESVTKSNELLMINRGWKKELIAAGDRGLTNDYQGCLADICPVGALTFTDFRFKKRVWFLKSSKSACDQCSKGCNISVDHEKNIVYRYRPEVNEKVNSHWMCDEGRKSYHTFMNHDRIVSPMVRPTNQPSQLSATTWETLQAVVLDELQKAKTVLVVLGTDCSTDEAAELMSQFPKLSKASVTFKFYNGVNGVTQSSDDKALDHLLRHKDKTPNTRGLEGLGLKPLQPSDKADLAFLIRFGRAGIPEKPVATREIAWGVWNQMEADPSRFLAVIPGLASIEKKVRFTNCDQLEQVFEPAITHTGDGRSVTTILNAWKTQPDWTTPTAKSTTQWSTS